MTVIRPARVHTPSADVMAHDQGAQYHFQSQGGFTVVAVTGDLDVATGPELTAQLSGLIEAEQVSIVLDLAGLAFLDAAGITALVIAVRIARERRGRLHLARVPVRAARVLDLGWPFWRQIAFDTVAAAAADAD
jgi:anti-anti-sigma factor